MVKFTFSHESRTLRPGSVFPDCSRKLIYFATSMRYSPSELSAVEYLVETVNLEVDMTTNILIQHTHGNRAFTIVGLHCTARVCRTISFKPEQKAGIRPSL